MDTETRMDKVAEEREMRQTTLRELLEAREQMTMRDRLVKLNIVLNSMFDEHNAITEPAGNYPGDVHCSATPADLAAFDQWWGGGDLWDLICHVARRFPFDPNVLGSTLPERPDPAS